MSTVRRFLSTLLGGILAAVCGAGAMGQISESAGLVAHWPFDYDLSSSVNNDRYQGRANGGERLRVDRGASVPRVGGGALRLESGLKTGDPVFVAVDNPPSGLMGTEVITFSAWFKLADLAGDGMDSRNFVWESIPNSALSFSLGTLKQKKVTQFRFRTENYRVLTQADGPAVSPGTWHHVACVWNARAGHVRVYLNGSLIKESRMSDATIGGGVPTSAAANGDTARSWMGLEPVRGLHIGGNKFGNGLADWDGWIDDFAIFDLELTPRQIAALAGKEDVSAANVLTLVPEPELQRLATSGKQLPLPDIPAHEANSQGPLIGHVDASSAMVWARVPQPGRYTLVAQSDGNPDRRVTVSAELDNDWCVTWRLEGLQADTVYRVSFELPAENSFELVPLVLRTPPAPETLAKVVLGFGSCSDFPDNRIWAKIGEQCQDGMVLLGDTPYIDTTALPWMRWAYRRFSSIPQFVQTFQKIPFWGTWDDHDFGANNSDGTLPGKEASRQAFVEYRPMAQIGEHNRGTYTSFRRGPVEVFLLDTRWFARTEGSWADAEKPGLLGRQQWEWLQQGLRNSTAPFKILACGIIWDGKGDSPEADAWGSYAYERDALFRWLGDNAISGVVLVGGDIHVSRLIKFPVRELAGYDLYEFITSPMHDRVFPGANVPDPNLIDSSVESWVFLKMTADSTRSEPVLVAELINRDGKHFFRREIALSEISPAPR